jgi:hypothetical protein
MKKAIYIRVLIVLAMTCLFLFSACHKLPECENQQTGTIYYQKNEKNCEFDEIVCLIMDDSPNDTLIIKNNVQQKFKETKLRVEVEYVHLVWAFAFIPSSNWCGPDDFSFIEVKCINEL